MFLMKTVRQFFYEDCRLANDGSSDSGKIITAAAAAVPLLQKNLAVGLARGYP